MSRFVKLAAVPAVLSLAAAFSPAGAPAASAASYPSLWYNIEYGSAGWQGWEEPTQPPGLVVGGPVGISTTGGDAHVDVATTSGLWDNIRYGVNGSWQGWAKPPQVPGAVFRLYEAADQYGTVWYVAWTDSGSLYFNFRASDGGWGAWTPVHGGGIPGNPTIIDVAMAVTGADELQIGLITGGATLWHTEYNIDNHSWQVWAQPAQPPGGATQVGMVGLANGDMEMLVSAGASGSNWIYHNIRYASGSWQGWAKPAQPPMAGTYANGPIISAAADLNGNAQFLLTYQTTSTSDDHNTSYIITRWAGGSWTGWRELLNASTWCVPKITQQTFGYEDTESHLDEVCRSNYGLFP